MVCAGWKGQWHLKADGVCKALFSWHGERVWSHLGCQGRCQEEPSPHCILTGRMLCCSYPLASLKCHISGFHMRNSLGPESVPFSKSFPLQTAIMDCKANVLHRRNSWTISEAPEEDYISSAPACPEHGYFYPFLIIYWL